MQAGPDVLAHPHEAPGAVSAENFAAEDVGDPFEEEEEDDDLSSEHPVASRFSKNGRILRQKNLHANLAPACGRSIQMCLRNC